MFCQKRTKQFNKNVSHIVFGRLPRGRRLFRVFLIKGVGFGKLGRAGDRRFPPPPGNYLSLCRLRGALGRLGAPEAGRITKPGGFFSAPGPLTL